MTKKEAIKLFEEKKARAVWEIGRASCRERV